MIAFADAETRLGASIVRCLSNAAADFGGGLEIDGVLTEGPGATIIEGIPIATRITTFECNTAALNAGSVAQGSTVTIAGTLYNIRRRDDDPHTGNTMLELDD
jgi:hypothetical protein